MNIKQFFKPVYLLILGIVLLISLLMTNSLSIYHNSAYTNLNEFQTGWTENKGIGTFSFLDNTMIMSKDGTDDYVWALKTRAMSITEDTMEFYYKIPLTANPYYIGLLLKSSGNQCYHKASGLINDNAWHLVQWRTNDFSEDNLCTLSNIDNIELFYRDSSDPSTFDVSFKDLRMLNTAGESCEDDIKNGDEDFVDCGGSCSESCGIKYGSDGEFSEFGGEDQLDCRFDQSFDFKSCDIDTYGEPSELGSLGTFEDNFATKLIGEMLSIVNDFFRWLNSFLI